MIKALVELTSKLVNDKAALAALGVVVILTASITHVVPKLIDYRAAEQAKVEEQFEKEKENYLTVLNLKTQLKAITEIKKDELRPLLQRFVDIQEHPAWFKIFDPTEEDERALFKLEAINLNYANMFGTCYPYKGKTAVELYGQCRLDLTEEDLEEMFAYQLNDRKAANHPRQACLIFDERAFLANPKEGEDPSPMLLFRKCAMQAGTFLLVYGELYQGKVDS